MSVEPVLVVVLGLCSLIAGAMFLVLAAFAKQMPGVRLWAAGSSLIGAASLVSGLDLIADPQLSPAVVNSSICIGQALVLAGIMRYRMIPSAYRVLFGLSLVSVLLALVFTYPVQQSVLQVVSLLLVLGVIHGWSAWILWRHAEPFARWVYRAAAVIVLLHGLTSLTQGYDLLAKSEALGRHLPPIPAFERAGLWGAIIGTLLGYWMLFLLVMLRLLFEVRDAADRDPLTGLLNRRGLRRQVDPLLEREPGQGLRIAVLLMDIDRFKAINDQHGHELGDEVLALMGEVLRSPVTRGALACRWGGEEFCVLIEGATAEQAVATAEAIRSRFQASAAGLARLPDGATVSIGVALLDTEDSSTLSGLVAAADAELYRAKAAGRNRVSAALLPDVAH